MTVLTVLRNALHQKFSLLTYNLAVWSFKNLSLLRDISPFFSNIHSLPPHLYFHLLHIILYIMQLYQSRSSLFFFFYLTYYPYYLNVLSSTSSGPALEPTQPPIRSVPRALSLGVKRQGREAVHLCPTSAEVRKMWIYTSTPPYTFMA
jgi:hypothetical protein